MNKILNNDIRKELVSLDLKINSPVWKYCVENKIKISIFLQQIQSFSKILGRYDKR